MDASDDGLRLALSWGSGIGEGGAVRFNQFANELSPAFAKTAASAAEVDSVAVGDSEGLWFGEPHELVLIGPGGQERPNAARAAGPTLVWEQAGVTMRLEGLDKPAAPCAAESVTAW